eukprot:g41854.t1
MSNVRARVSQRAHRILNKPPLLPPGLGLLDSALVPGFESGEDQKHPIAEVLSHQFLPIHNQLDAGLFTSKNLYVSLDSIVQVQLKAAEAEAKFEEMQTTIKAKTSKHQTHDLCANFVNGAGAASDVMRHTQKRFQQFTEQVQEELVQPLSDFYQRAKAQRKQLLLVYEMKAKSLKDQEDSLERVKSQSLAQTELVRSLSKQRDNAEAKNMPTVTKLAKKVKVEKAKLIKLMRQYEKELAATNMTRRNWHEQEQRQLVDALGKLERKRLSLLQECLAKYQLRFETLVIELQDSSKLLKTVMGNLNPAKAYCDNVDNWVRLFGLPPPVPPQEYELPYSIEDIEAEHYTADNNNDVHNDNAAHPAGSSLHNPPVPQQSGGIVQTHQAGPTGQATAHSSNSNSNSALAVVSAESANSHSLNSTPGQSFSTLSASEGNSECEERRPLRITYNQGSVVDHAHTTSSKENAVWSSQNNQTVAKAGSSSEQQQDKGGAGGQPNRAPAAEFEEDLICHAEALFDFSLPADPENEVVYISFKVGQRIDVFEMEDEWWYGRCNGQVGYFPYTYVKKLEEVGGRSAEGSPGAVTT